MELSTLTEQLRMIRGRRVLFVLHILTLSRTKVKLRVKNTKKLFQKFYIFNFWLDLSIYERFRKVVSAAKIPQIVGTTKEKVIFLTAIFLLLMFFL